jgi:hypothetical protein
LKRKRLKEKELRLSSNARQRSLTAPKTPLPDLKIQEPAQQAKE